MPNPIPKKDKGWVISVSRAVSIAPAHPLLGVVHLGGGMFPDILCYLNRTAFQLIDVVEQDFTRFCRGIIFHDFKGVGFYCSLNRRLGHATKSAFNLTHTAIATSIPKASLPFLMDRCVLRFWIFACMLIARRETLTSSPFFAACKTSTVLEGQKTNGLKWCVIASCLR